MREKRAPGSPVVDPGARLSAVTPIPRVLLARGVALLEAAGVDEARLVAELLLAAALGRDRTYLYAHPDEPLDPSAWRLWQRLLRRARGHEPVAYLLHRRQFYGLDFYVDRRVLIPRPETELLVEEALAWARTFAARHDRPPLIADVATGSGAIAVALAVHLPEARLYATDLSTAALAVARCNARRQGVDERLTFRQGDLLAALPEPVDLLAANLPYVTEAELAVLPAHIASYEPAGALAGGEDGLDLVRRLLSQSPDKVRAGGLVLLEVGSGHAESAAALAGDAFPAATVRVLPDAAALPRLVRIDLP
ncbi:MAG: peptide chain release factor N(5)-glutamine methyltransferase [Chloroflexota bacterium]